jgi:hypothetical protein
MLSPTVQFDDLHVHHAFAFGGSRAGRAVDVVVVSVDKRSELAAVIKNMAVSRCVIAEALFVCCVLHSFLEDGGRDGRRGSYSCKDVMAVHVVFCAVSVLLMYGAGAGASSDVSFCGRGGLGGVPHCTLPPLAIWHEFRVCNPAELIEHCVLPVAVISHACQR